MFDMLCGSKVFSKIDLKRKYYQICICEGYDLKIFMKRLKKKMNTK